MGEDPDENNWYQTLPVDQVDEGSLRPDVNKCHLDYGNQEFHKTQTPAKCTWIKQTS